MVAPGNARPSSSAVRRAPVTEARSRRLPQFGQLDYACPMRIAKPMLLVSTPLGVAFGLAAVLIRAPVLT